MKPAMINFVIPISHIYLSRKYVYKYKNKSPRLLCASFQEEAIYIYVDSRTLLTHRGLLFL